MPPRLSRHGAKPRSVSLVQARALVQLDRLEDAERQLLGLLQADAGDVEAHGLLVQLRQLRGDEEPLAAMRAAAQASSATPRLRLAFADAARRAGATTEAEAILRELMNTFGPEPMLLSSLATVLQESGRTSEALDAARASIARLPDDAVVAENFVVAALCAGASPEALPVVEKFRALKPLDQRWITYRLDIARLRAEEEFASWFDPARVVSIVDLPPPHRIRDHRGISFRSRAGASIAAPAAESSARPESAPRHPDLAQPAGESRRGNRWRCCNPSAKRSRTCRHVPAATPPILSTARNLSPAEIIGCWSVRLRRGGFHVNHIHPEGWVSSAYYASVPDEVDDSTLRSGWLKFGEPRFAVPGLAPFLEVQPRPGRLVLFPSYLWHGTHALRGDAPRMSVPFDAVPQAELG